MIIAPAATIPEKNSFIKYTFVKHTPSTNCIVTAPAVLSPYFNPKSIKIYSEQEDFSIFFPKPLTDNTPNGKKDMLFIHHISDFPSPEELTAQMHNDSVLVWVSPHSPENEPTVKKLTENKKFSVIIDTFSFALFFIRKEQSREVFFIRT